MNNQTQILKPKQSLTENDRKDNESVLNIETLLVRQNANPSIHSHDKEANIDGYIELLNGNLPTGKITVQVKTFNPLYHGRGTYPIPAYIVGYAESMINELVVLILSDFEGKRFFWKVIDSEYIRMFEQSGCKTKTYQFKNDEIADKDNISETLRKWQNLYDEKTAIFRDEQENASRFIERQRIPFNTIVPHFFNIPSSHIHRKETDQIIQWIHNPLEGEEKPICILSGPAGCGKSVVIKDLLEHLDETGQPCLAIKADQAYLTDSTQLLKTLYTLCAKGSKAILVIDQLDALSRYLSNDRTKLNLLLAAIASVCKSSQSANIRVIVSCREFDLQNDSRISKILSKEPIRMSGLSKDEVRQTMELLDKGLYEKTGKELRALLTTPQYLDSFCRIYHSCRQPLLIATNIDLYDALWQEIIHPDIPVPGENIETVLYDLAKAVIKSETLNPVHLFAGKKMKAAEYLKSEGILLQQDDHVAFFHQTFFEYVYARQLASSGKSLKNSIGKIHQGLFVRNRVKLTLDYLKGKDPARYIEEINELLLSAGIRTHIKALVLDSMAFSGSVSFAEQTLIKQLYQEDKRLFNYFIRKAWSDGWFRPVMNILSQSLPEIKEESAGYHPVLLFFSHFCERHTKDIFQALGKIADKKTRENSVNYLLTGNCDYNEKSVLTWYRELDKASALNNKTACLTAAARSNMTFALEEISVLVYQNLQNNHYTGNQRNNQHGVLRLCQRLGEKYPEEICKLLKQCIIRFTCSKLYESCRGGLSFAPFDTMSYPDSNLKLLELLKELTLGKDLDLQKEIVADLLVCREDFTSAIAFEIMTKVPEQYEESIRAILEAPAYTSQIIQSSESEYWFMELLKKWLEKADSLTIDWFHAYLLNYKSPLDKLSNKERSAYRPQLYPYLGEEQWKLIHTVPSQKMGTALKKKMLELDRRFGGEPKIHKPSHGASMAAVCGRLVPAKICKSFSEKKWKEFILGSPNYKDRRRNGRWVPVDERMNIDDFAEYIAQNPALHLAFVNELISDSHIDKSFKYAGIKGLAKGNIEPERVMGLLEAFADSDDYEYDEIIDLLTETDSSVIDMLIPELHKKIEKYEPIGFLSGSESDIMKRVNEIVSHVINTRPGRALDCLIQIAHIEARRNEVYKRLIEWREEMDSELQLFTIWRLYSEELYQKELYATLLDAYLQNPLPEFLLLNRQCIFNHYVEGVQSVSAYLDIMLRHPACHDVLAQIHFLAHSVENLQQKAEEVLKTLLSLKEDDCFKNLTKICISNLDDDDYREIAISLLETMTAKDSENKFAAKALYAHCYELSINDLPLFVRLLKKTDPKTCRSGHSVLSYLEKCASDYPQECYECLKHIDTDNPDDKVDEESYIILLLKLYAVLKENADKKTMESIMDIFDKHIVMDHYGFRQALAEVDKD